MKDKTKLLSDDEIVDMIDANRWDDIYNDILNGNIEKPNKILINGNNLFHMACIRGETEFVEKIFNLCYSTTNNDSYLSEHLNIMSNIKCIINPDIPNDDGLPGIHLYYKYGGRSKKLLQLSSVCYLDRSYKSLLKYLVDKIDLLEVYIDSTIEKSCLMNIEIMSSSKSDEIEEKFYEKFYYILINQIKKTEDTELINRYLKIIKLLMLNLSNKKVIHYAIAMDSMNVFDYLVKENLFDPMFRDGNDDTPLIMAVDYGNSAFIERILTVYSELENDIDRDLPNKREYIQMYRSYSDGRPINTCIMNNLLASNLKILIKHLEEWRQKNNDSTLHDETDEYNSTYLHNLLMRDNAIESFSDNVIRYLIKYTDMNQQNYYGDTPAQLIFAKGYWKFDIIKSELMGRKIDLLKIDSNNKNIYSYIDDDDQKEFMDFVSNIILLPNTKGTSNVEAEIHDMERIIDVVSHERLNDRKDYGLFSPTQLTYLLLILHIQKKHSNLFIPCRVYNEERQQDQRYLMEMTSYSISSIQELLNMNQLMDHVKYYSYVPHFITWHDSKLYTISPDLVNILKEQDQKDHNMNRRFVFIKMLIIINEKSYHANCMVYDRKKKEAWRFESYGLTDLVKDGNIMDMKIESLLESVYGKIKYYAPSAYLANIKFQLADSEDNSIVRNLGDPGGYCMAWCIWFVDVICSNIDDSKSNMTVEYLMRKYITRERLDAIIIKDNMAMPNLYLDYIRQYGHHLDQEKNKIMRELGLPRDLYYKFTMRMTDIKKIETALRVLEIKYD